MTVSGVSHGPQFGQTRPSQSLNSRNLLNSQRDPAVEMHKTAGAPPDPAFKNITKFIDLINKELDTVKLDDRETALGLKGSQIMPDSQKGLKVSETS